MNEQPQKVYTGLATVEGDGTVQIGSEQPQEWTPETYYDIINRRKVNTTEAESICVAHNAAIAAEQKKLADADEHYVRNVELLRKQLADADTEYEQKLVAERSKLQAQEHRVIDEIQLFEQQLAANRYKLAIELCKEQKAHVDALDALAAVTKQRDDFRRALEGRIGEADETQHMKRMLEHARKVRSMKEEG